MNKGFKDIAEAMDEWAVSALKQYRPGRKPAKRGVDSE